MFRPKGCITVNNNGDHNVFVCPSLSITRCYIMALLVYDITNEECMLKWCDDCPSTDNLRKRTSGSLLEANDTDDDICYSQ